VQKGKFPVVGFVKDPTGVAALYLGKQDGKDLVYAGKVGTGWSRTVSSQIRKQLDTVVSPKSKLTRPIRKPKATWAEPKFYADVEFRDITFVQRAYQGNPRTLATPATGYPVIKSSSFGVASGSLTVAENRLALRINWSIFGVLDERIEETFGVRLRYNWPADPG
jgi:ATP dependent DNA ligase-like protein